MKRKRHTPEQIIAKLREADAMLAGGRTIGQVVQHLGVSEQTFHRRRNQYGEMKAGDAKRLKQLEQENARLKRAVADLTLDNRCSRRSPRETSEPGLQTAGGRASAGEVRRPTTPHVPGCESTPFDSAIRIQTT